MGRKHNHVELGLELNVLGDNAFDPSQNRSTAPCPVTRCFTYRGGQELVCAYVQAISRMAVGCWRWRKSWRPTASPVSRWRIYWKAGMSTRRRMSSGCRRRSGRSSCTARRRIRTSRSSSPMQCTPSRGAMGSSRGICRRTGRRSAEPRAPGQRRGRHGDVHQQGRRGAVVSKKATKAAGMQCVLRDPAREPKLRLLCDSRLWLSVAEITEIPGVTP